MTTIELTDKPPTPDPPGRRLDGTFNVPAWLVLQILLWVIAALMTYSAVNARVAVVESEVNGVKVRLDRIEMKIDKVLEEHNR